MNPTDSRLAEHATGQELDQIRRSFADHFGRGEVIRGTLDLAPHVTAVSGSTATVTDCYADATHVFDSATGAQKDPPQTVRYKITATLALEAGTWKVSSIRKEGQGCTPS